MNRREALLGVLLAPLVKPLAKLLPAPTVCDLVPGNLPKPIFYGAVDGGVDLHDRLVWETLRRINCSIEDDIINGYDPVVQVYDNGEPVDHEPGSLPASVWR